MRISLSALRVSEASLERWSTEGISEITWEEAAVAADRQRATIVCSCMHAGHAEDLLLHGTACIIFHYAGPQLADVLLSSCAVSAASCQERHIDLPYKHWNMRCCSLIALRPCLSCFDR